MKKVFGWMLAAVLMISASAAFADCGTCGSDAKAKGGKPPCCMALEKLTLTADQKAKVTALQAECMKGGVSKEGCQKMCEGLKKILTNDQYQQWEKACSEAKKSGDCPAKTGSCPVKTQ